jgi:hypothetical protein
MVRKSNFRLWAVRSSGSTEIGPDSTEKPLLILKSLLHGRERKLSPLRTNDSGRYSESAVLGQLFVFWWLGSPA